VKVSRCFNFAVAVVITAIQWAAFFSPALTMKSVSSLAVSVVSDAYDDSLPAVVITAHRQS
jgi:hypothetical protein